MKKHPTALRNRDEDLQKLATVFLSELCQLNSKHETKMWGIDPKQPLGGTRDQYIDNVLAVIGYFDVAPCDKCNHVEEKPKKDKKAIAYAKELHEDLGTYIYRTWQDLNELSEDEEEEEESEEDEGWCYQCGTQTYECECETCENCCNKLADCKCEEVSEEDCETCGYTIDECECCADCGFYGSDCECDEGELN